MSYRCDRCGRDWEEEAARLNAFRCYSGCGGTLELAQGTSSRDQGQSLIEGFGRLPVVLAIPLSEYAVEKHSVMRLLRLCEAVEILTRFLTIIALGELRRCAHLSEGTLPEQVLAVFQPRIERPTFGQWRDMLRCLNEYLSSGQALVVVELPGFISKHLAPLMPGGNAFPEDCLLNLRNLLVHGGGMSQSRAAELLVAWEPRLDGLLAKLDFLSACDVVHFARGKAYRLAMPGAAPEEALTCVDTELAFKELDDHVVLLRSQQCLDLWPLCLYGRAVATTPAGSRPASADSPLIYFRANVDRLLYAALGTDLPYGDKPDAIGEFRSLFKLDDRKPDEPLTAIDFEAEIHRDAAELAGRVQEIKRLKDAVKSAQEGVLWIEGPGGIGKSFLMAKLADDLGNSPPERLCRIAWRFKVGDHARCNRSAFLRHAVGSLARWPPLGTDVVPASDPKQLADQLRNLLIEVARLTPTDQRGKAPRVVFVLDGLDEIARLDPEFERIPFDLSAPNVVWVCAGRPEQSLPQVFAPQRCIHIFRGGLPPMSDADIRGMLVDGSGSLKYELLPLDHERTDAEGKVEVTNTAVKAVVDRAAGLPLYVHFVLADILSGHFKFAELPHRLPAGLSAYYDELLKRLAIGDTQALLTPLVVTIAWSKAPLDEETLHLFMVRRKVLPEGDGGRLVLRRGLNAIGSMVRQAPIAGTQTLGYEAYHPTFRDHIRADEAKTLAYQNALAQTEFCALAMGWSAIAATHPARLYALRFGPQMLIEARHWEESEHWKHVGALLTDLCFLEEKTKAGLVFELVQDFASAVSAMPGDFERRRNLQLLEEALRRDIHFIDRHREDYPQGLFQCLWNSCWWYDCPQAAAHYIEPKGGWSEPPPWEAKQSRLCNLLAAWHTAKDGVWANHRWLRSLRPPAINLGGGLAAVLRHEGYVFTVTFSPDSRRIASSDGQTVRVWDAETGAQLRQLRGHEDAVNSVAFSPDGRRIASCSGDRTVRVWDAQTGSELRQLRGHEDAVISVAFSPDGRRIASCSKDRTVQVWDAQTGSELRQLRGHEDAVRSVAFSPDGRRIASCSHDGTVRVWDAQTGAQLRLLRGHASSVGSVAFSPDGHRIVSGSNDGMLRMWDVETASERRQFHGPEGQVLSVAFSPDGRRIVSGSKDRMLRMWDAETGGELRVFHGHDQVVTSVAFSLDGRRIAIGALYSVRVWDVETGSELRQLRGHEDDVMIVAFSPDGRRIASGAEDNTVRVWDAQAGTQLRVLRGHRESVMIVAFSPDGRRIASGSKDNTVRVWDAETGTQLHQLRGHEDCVTSVAFSPDGRRIASGSKDKDNTVRVWDAETGAELRILRGHSWSVIAIGFSPDGRRIASGSWDRTVRVWDTETGVQLHHLRGHEDVVWSVAFSSDGRRIVSRSYDPTIRLWDAETGRQLGVFDWTDDAERIAGAMTARTYRMLRSDAETVIEETTGQVVARFPERSGYSTRHPSGRLWAITTASHLQLLHLEDPSAVSSSPCG
jgi:WD40 repeat protein